jgi:hypothetical protein
MQLYQRIKITEKTINPRKGFYFLRFRFTLNLLTGGQFKKLVTGCVCIIALSGCATFNTLDTELPLNERMFVYSGTRLDWAAITKNHPALKKIKGVFVKPCGKCLKNQPEFQCQNRKTVWK